MLDAFKEEVIVNKIGGRFKLSTLIQKRLVALNRGSSPLVDKGTKSQMEIVVEEIMKDKIFLDESGNVAVNSGEAGEDSPGLDVVTDDAGPTLDDIMGEIDE
jgi:DNA-directed RNA polymerase subunit omega